MDSLLSRRTILVVEDEMLVLMNVQEMLADLGCESVISAATADQALALLDAHVIDAGMLDVNLNGEKSFAVADALAARGVPFLFASGCGVAGLPDGYRGRPMLTKPFGQKELAIVPQCVV